MLDLSTVKVVPKDWGTQVWLNYYEMLMVMNADCETSMHCHRQHDTHLQLLSGKATFETRSGEVYAIDHDNLTMYADEWHKIHAVEFSVIYEQYIPVSVIPEQDIERRPC